MNKPKNAVTLTEYGDYECPHCGRAYPIVKRLQKEFGDNLNFEFKNFPLIELHPHALMAAEAAEFARDQGVFEEMHDALFDNQRQLSRDLILGIGEKLKLNLEKLSMALSSHSYVPRIQQEVDEGLKNGVQGTPTFFINGRFFDEQWTFEGLEAALKQELKSHSS